MGFYVDFSQLFEWIGVVAIAGFVVVLFFYFRSNYKVSRKHSEDNGDDYLVEQIEDGELNFYEWFTEEQVDLLKEQNRVYRD